MKKKTRNIIIGIVVASIVLCTSIIGIFINNANKKDMQLGQLDKVQEEPEILQATDSAFTIEDYPYDIKFTMIDGDSNGIIALDSSGYIWEWSNGNAPSKISTGLTKFKYIAKSYRGSVYIAIDTSGNIWTWGQGNYGMLGNGIKTNNTQTINTPTKITSGTNFTKVVAGSGHIVALDSSGNIWGWGQNKFGQLLDEAKGDYYQGSTWTITKPTKLTNGTQYIDLAVCGDNTIALNSSKKVYFKGYSNNGALLDNTYQSHIYNEDGSVSSARYYGSNTFVQIASDMTYTQLTGTNILYLLGTDKHVYKWTGGSHTVKPSLTQENTLPKITYISAKGNTLQYTLEDSSWVQKEIVLDIGGTELYALLDLNGDLWMKGHNDTGIICDGTTDYKSSYVRITGTSYTVTLNTNGGTINSGNVTSYVPGTEKTLPTNVTKSGYTFAGWYANSSFSGNAVTKIASTETGNKTYWAKWERNTPDTYTVTYNANGGSGSMANTIHTYGADSRLRKNTFTKTGYKFIGWTWEEFKDLLSADFADEALVSDLGEKGETVELYAVWIPNTYTVTYNANGGNGSMSDSTHAYGVENIVGVQAKLNKNAFTKLGYTFKGWSKDKNATTALYSDEEVVRGLTSEDKGTVVLYAIWEANRYEVTFKDGENVVKIETVNHGVGATAPSLTKEGYVLRWDKEFNNITSDLTVNAVWLKDTDKDGIPDIEDPETLVNYKVQHYKQNIAQNGYEDPEEQILQGNLGTTVIGEPKEYVGFNENTEHESRIPSGIVVDDGSLTLKLYYDRNTYTVRFDPNEGTINDQNYITEYTYGIGGNLPTDITKEGYTFGGWYDNAQLIGNAISQITNTDIGEKTYYASWNANGNTPYKVEHYKQVENGYILEETDNLTSLTGANVTAVPKAYEGYVENLNHEDRVASGTVLGDGSLELKLYYDKITYEVIFKDGETVLDTQEVNYGESAEAPRLTKEGYVLRWDKEFNEVKSDLTVNAVWLKDTDKDGIPDIEDPETLVEYIVKHYKQQGRTNTYELAETERLQGQLGTNVTAVPKTYEGYVENTNVAERIPSGEIKAEETLELRLFYNTITYTVVFKDGDNIISTQIINYGENAIAPELTKEGYILSWDKDFNSVKSDLEVNAIWTKMTEEQRNYKVEHYVETKEGNYILRETETLVGDIGDIVIAKAKIYEEYLLNETHKDTIKTGEIGEDNELVLKLYYKYKRYEIIFKDGEEEVERQEVIYGETAKPPVLTKPGYILSWDKDISNITKDEIITAVWTKDPNYKDPNAGKDDDKDDGKQEIPSILPKTGEETITLGAIMGLLGIAVVYFVKYKF